MCGEREIVVGREGEKKVSSVCRGICIGGSRWQAGRHVSPSQEGKGGGRTMSSELGQGQVEEREDQGVRAWLVAMLPWVGGRPPFPKAQKWQSKGRQWKWEVSHCLVVAVWDLDYRKKQCHNTGQAWHVKNAKARKEQVGMESEWMEGGVVVLFLFLLGVGR